MCQLPKYFWGIVGLVAILCALGTQLWQRGANYIPKPENVEEDFCDFIIIGAGTTGLALGARLSEIPQWKVCILERGPKEKSVHPWHIKYQFSTPHDPLFVTEPLLGTMETSSSGDLHNKNKDARRLYIPRFQGMGGTSRVYGAVVRRPSPGVLDLWPKGWRSEDLTPYYIKSEDHFCHYDSEESTGISREDCEKWHGKGGPLQVNSKIIAAFRALPKAMEYMCKNKTMPWGGYVPDYNNPLNERHGCSHFQQFKIRINDEEESTEEARVNEASKTTRGNSYTGYFVNSKNKPRVLSSVTVLSIVFEDGKATGVIYLDNNNKSTHTIFAQKEVILSAGAFSTPHILQVSGVGPKEHLEDIGVPVIANNMHVGSNLWDHLLVSYVLKLNRNAGNFYCASNKGTDCKTETFTNISSPFQWIVHLQSNITSRMPRNISDIQLYVTTNSSLFDATSCLCTSSCGLDDGDFVTKIRVLDQWPEYRGSVMALTPSVLDKPRIDYGMTFMTDGKHSDSFLKVSQLMRDQIRSLRELFFGKDVHPGLRELLEGEIAPGEDVQTDDELNNWIRQVLISALHPTGTCRMPECVDEALRVKGVTNLRVCDASALPTQVDGNPAATLFAMAEKLAELLKEKYLSHMN